MSMYLRTQAAFLFRLFAALVLAAAGSQAHAQVIIPSMSSSGVAGFHNVAATINAVATVSSTPLPVGGTVTFTVLDAAATPLFTPCLNAVLVLGPSADSACTFPAPTTTGSYFLRMDYSGDGIAVGSQFISEPFTVGRYFTNITYTGIANTFTPVKAGTTLNVVATVNGSGPLPTGTLQFDLYKSSVLVRPLCTVALDASAQASCTYTTNAPGFYEIYISYSGDASNDPSGPVNPFVHVGHTVVSSADSGPGTLRAALAAANLDCASSTAILFDIPGTGPHLISVASELPLLLCNGADVDGSTQPGWSPNTSGFGGINASLQVIVSGSACGPGCRGLILGGNSNMVRGLAIHSFQGTGIAVASSGAVIVGNYIGTDPGGAAAFGNGTGIEVIGSANIGGAAPADSNLVVNSAGDGIRITTSSNAFIDNTLVGGLTNGAPGNGNGTGIRISGGSVGYVVASAIRYNSGAGVLIESGSNGALSDNAAYDNGGPGIDLDGDGATLNDEAGPPYDADLGANGKQNYPTLTSVTSSSGVVTVSGYLKTNAPNTFTNVFIELYSNIVPRPGATGGDNIIGGFPLTLDSSGFGSFTQTIPGSYDNISATATVDSCSPPLLRDPALEPKARRAAKAARSIGGTCPVTSEYSPTVAAVASGPAITLDTTGLSFTAAAGTSAAPQTVTLTNSGLSPLTFALTPFTVPADFTLAHGCPPPPSTLGVGLSCQAIVTFIAPAAPGTYSATIKINSDAVVARDIAVIGVSTAPAALAFSPASLTFAPQGVGTASAPQTVTVSNPSSTAVAIASITTTGDFAVLHNCPASLAKGATCTIDANFLPTAAGARAGSIDIGAAGTLYGVSLAGTGLAPATPLATVSPPSLAFANRTLFTASPPQQVTLTNDGTAPLAIGAITVSGDFAFTSACPKSLGVGASCSIAVTFTPLITGTRTGNLVISTNASGSPSVVSLVGRGVDVPVGTLDISPTLLDFAAQPLNVASAPQPVSVTNVGSATVFILDIALTGDFAFGDVAAPDRACGGPLAPGATCVLAVTFTPTASGTRSGRLTVASDGTNFTAEVGLTGFGVAVVPQRALAVPAALAFGAQPFGTRSGGQVVELTNSSAAPVVVSDIDASGDFSVTESCTTIPARGSCSATVFFTPTARGARTGVLTVRILSDTQPYLVTLSGEGTANLVPILSVTPVRIGFGNAFVGAISAAAAVTLANIGEAPLLLDGFTAPGDFVIESQCGDVLAAGASCTVEVRFFARMLDARSGLLEIRSNAGGSPHFVELSGTGCSIPNVGRSRTPQLLCGP